MIIKVEKTIRSLIYSIGGKTLCMKLSTLQQLQKNILNLVMFGIEAR